MGQDRGPGIGNGVLEGILKLNGIYNRFFTQFSEIDLTALNNYQIAHFLYRIGRGLGKLDGLSDSTKNNPNYEEVHVRLETIRDKLYAEARRRDFLQGE